MMQHYPEIKMRNFHFNLLFITS